MRLGVFLVGAMALAGFVPAACVSDPTSNYGQADGLVGRPPPSASGTTTTPPMDAATMPEAGDAAKAEAAHPCAESWSKTIFPMFESTGTGQCGSSTTCHASGGIDPNVIDGDAATTYANFAQYTQINGIPYVDTGDTNAADSAMDCNLVLGTCGGTPMPMAPGMLSATQLATIGKWLACGAPQN
jgi:hypothetical protein